MDADLGKLYTLVTEAIMRADVLSDLGAPGASAAYLDVSLLEERIAELLPASDPEGALARRGAVRAAVVAGDDARASDLAARYSGESNASEDLRQALGDLLSTVREVEPDVRDTSQSPPTNNPEAVEGSGGEAHRQQRPTTAPLRDPVAPTLKLFPTCILVILMDRPTAGYELLEQVRRLGVLGAEPGALYRYLRWMEQEELVSGWWEPSQAGPTRKYYVVTEQGRKELKAQGPALKKLFNMLGSLLDRLEVIESAQRARPASSFER